MAGLVKSNKAQHFMDLSPGAFLEKEIALGLATHLLREVAVVNGSGQGCNTIDAVQFIGEILGNISGGVAFVEASISVRPCHSITSIGHHSRSME